MKKRERKQTTIKATFEKAIRGTLSPHAVAAAICYLRSAEIGDKPTTEQGIAALRELKWLADTLTEMLGVNEYKSLLEELGL
ncbi:MAG: hypothetical protein KatS3mg109_0675 [Pirellulaceae bacterium]|nr:MAG: hypothetical protein KatS3mg109_0615 [Pirellulaceae bacterium]GIW90243.1 MAG: hypothetical protein KatS3mg109_0675 [Pirellulaceae bacterium]